MLSKYRTLSGFTSFNQFENEINELGELGYVVAQSGTIGDKLYAILKLDVGNYQDVVNLKDVVPEEVDAHIAQGFEISSTSISTKFVRMVRRKAPTQTPTIPTIPELRQIRQIESRESMNTAPMERTILSPGRHTQ